jgi:hypothetical protein
MKLPAGDTESPIKKQIRLKLRTGQKKLNPAWGTFWFTKWSTCWNATIMTVAYMDKFFAYSDRAELNKLPVRHEEIKRR